MKKFSLIWILPLFVFNAGVMLYGQQQDDNPPQNNLKSDFQRQQEQLRTKAFHGTETQEEKQYYEKVNPDSIPSGQNFYMQSHPNQGSQIPANKIPQNPIPSNQIPHNPIPSNPIE